MCTDFSQMVDLKAELYRKQEEFKKQKKTNATFIKANKSDKVYQRTEISSAFALITFSIVHYYIYVYNSMFQPAITRSICN